MPKGFWTKAFLKPLKEKVLKRSIALLILFIGLGMLVNAQQYRKDEDDKPGAKAQKVGVRIGIGTYWLNAPEMRPGSPRTGVQGAIYYRLGLTNRFDLNLEIGACYRGSKFPYDIDKDTSEYYTRLGLFYMELPILGMVSLDKGKKHNILFGPTVSYLIKPSLYIGYDYVTSYYPAFTELPIKRWDFGASIGYMYSVKYIGLYIGYKHGFSNIAGDFENSNFPRDSGNSAPRTLFEVTPSLRNVKNIFNRSFEVSLYF